MFLRNRYRAVRNHYQSGKMKTGLLLWLIGVPLPVILLIWLVKGCV